MDVYYRDTKLETISLNTTQAVDESGSVVFMRKMKKCCFTMCNGSCHHSCGFIISKKNHD